MSERIELKELTQRLSARLGQDVSDLSPIVEATFEDIYEALKNGERVSLRNFGTFYVRPERESWVFKFSPSQRLRKVLRWSSTYKGQV